MGVELLEGCRHNSGLFHTCLILAMGGSSQAKFKKPNEEEEFEVLDVRGTARNGMSWLQQFMQDLTRQPVAKQVAVGGLSGWVVGYVSMKVGKVAATVVGGSLLIMQLAAHKGYIKVDWNRVNRELEKNAKKLKQEVESTVNGGAADEAVRFARENIVLATSFGGGVLLGIASS